MTTREKVEPEIIEFKASEEISCNSSFDVCRCGQQWIKSGQGVTVVDLTTLRCKGCGIIAMVNPLYTMNISEVPKNVRSKFFKGQGGIDG